VAGQNLRAVPTIERTLVKSPPELWELVDDPELMARWSAELFGGADVHVLEREPESRLAWSSNGSARVELALAEKGWGTNVEIRVEGATGDAADALEELLDELASPQKRPFTRT
jgi:hypothetical protein